MKSTNYLKEQGQVLVLVAIAAVVLFGFTALAIDGSAKLSDRRHAQNAADTAANAAALAKVNALLDATKSQTPTACPAVTTPYSDVCTLLLQAGKDRAASNGYSNDIANNTVEVYSPPISGYYSTVANKDKYVQVVITSKVKTTFGRILGLSETINVVQAVALAEPGGKLFTGASIVSLNPNPNCSGGAGSGGGSVKVSGSGTIKLTGGGMFVNSSASCGFTEPNCVNFINSGGISSAGSAINLNACHGTSIPTNTSQVQFVVPDEVYIPDRPSQCSLTPKAPYEQVKGKGKNPSTWRIYEGYYTDFPPTALKGNDIVLDSGIYCIDKSVKWTGGDFSTLTGSNVTLYFLSGRDFDMSGGVLNLSATTAANSPYKGYLIIQDGKQSAIGDCTINGGGGGTVTGTIFTPYCDLKVNGNSGTDSLNAQIVAYNVTLNGNNTLNFNYNPGDNAKVSRKIGLLK